MARTAMHNPTNGTKISRPIRQCVKNTLRVPSPSKSWTKEEDQQLQQLVGDSVAHNHLWALVAAKIPGRTGKQCRERWTWTKPANKASRSWTEDEDKLLICLQKKHGNKWVTIAKHLPGRSKGSLSHRWNRLVRMGPANKQNNKGNEKKKITVSTCGKAKVGNKNTLLSTKKDFNTAYTTPAKTAHKCPTSAGSGSTMAAATLSAMRRGIFTPLDVNATTKYEPSAGQESEYHRQQMADGYSLQQSVEESSMYAHPPLPSYSGDNYHESRPFVPQLFHPVAAQDIFSPSFHAPKMSMPTTAYSTPAVPLAMTSDCFSGPFIADTPLFRQKTLDCINGATIANLFSSHENDDDFPSTRLPYNIMSSGLHYNCAV